MTEKKVLGNPDECPSENCKDCESFDTCRNKTLSRYGQNGSKDMKSLEKQARENSLGSLQFEEKGFTPN